MRREREHVLAASREGRQRQHVVGEVAEEGAAWRGGTGGDHAGAQRGRARRRPRAGSGRPRSPRSASRVPSGRLIDAVHEQRAAAGARERADMLLGYARIGGFGAAEQLAREQVRVLRCARDGDEGLRGAAAPRVDGARQMILARAASPARSGSGGRRARIAAAWPRSGRASPAHDPVAAAATHRPLDRSSALEARFLALHSTLAHLGMTSNPPGGRRRNLLLDRGPCQRNCGSIARPPG